MTPILVKDGHKYNGKYVAVRSFKNNEVLSSGHDPSIVLEKAKKRGAKKPVLVFVPKKDMVHIY
ncbi:MAG: hypothetical protein HZB30_11380 [Nitrospirae bacterium]|nr:hypothetical protein [Nitrospirota bacterium]